MYPVFLAFSWFEYLEFVVFGFIKFKHLETFKNSHVGPVERRKCLKSVTYLDIWGLIFWGGTCWVPVEQVAY